MSVLRGEAARRVLARVRPARRHPLTRRPTDAGAADSAARPESGSRLAQTLDLIPAQASGTNQLALADHG